MKITIILLLFISISAFDIGLYAPESANILSNIILEKEIQHKQQTFHHDSQQADIGYENACFWPFHFFSDANKSLKKHFKRNPSYTNEKRKAVSSIVLGVCVMNKRLQFLLKNSVSNFEFSTSEKCDLLVELFLRERGIVLPHSSAAVKSDDPLLWGKFETMEDRIGFEYSMPQWLIKMWFDQGFIETEVRSLCSKMNSPGPICLRANLLKMTDRDELIEQFKHHYPTLETEASVLSPWGIYLKNGRPPHGILKLEGWSEGKFQVQDEGSQLIALATETSPGMRVLDYCAGNGGKTLALGSMMKNDGQIFTYDVDKVRLKALQANAQRVGVTCAHVIDQMEVFKETQQGSFDIVLVDVVCSSIGVLRRHPGLRWSLREEDAKLNLPKLQYHILTEASKFVQEGGLLVYATCAINKLENEDIVAKFEADHNEVSVEWTWEGMPFPGQTSHMKNLLPHVHGTDGFFIARWRKMGKV